MRDIFGAPRAKRTAQDEGERLAEDDVTARGRVYARAPLGNALLADLELAPLAALVGSGTPKIGNCTIWLGDGGNVTPLHYDLCHGLVVQVRGVKRFTYVHPDDSRHLYQRPERPEVSRVDLDAWQLGAETAAGAEERRIHPDFAQVGQLWSVELRPGDVLYTPPYHWHHVETLDDEPALSVLVPFDPTPEEPVHPCHFWPVSSS